MKAALIAGPGLNGKRAANTMTDTAVKHATSAARTRAYRQRKREGCILVRMDISVDGARALQLLGWLSPSDTRNPSALAAAILALGSAALTKAYARPIRNMFPKSPISVKRRQQPRFGSLARARPRVGGGKL
jgi:hypothetical protein